MTENSSGIIDIINIPVRYFKDLLCLKINIEKDKKRKKRLILIILSKCKLIPDEHMIIFFSRHYQRNINHNNLKFTPSSLIMATNNSSR